MGGLTWPGTVMPELRSQGCGQLGEDLGDGSGSGNSPRRPRRKEVALRRRREKAGGGGGIRQVRVRLHM